MRRIVCGLFAFSLALGAARALDLTPKAGVIKRDEGGPLSTLEFTDGKTRFSYIPPTDWRPSGGGDTLTFYTSEPTSTMKLMVVAKGKAEQTAPPPSADALQAWATKFVPGGAEKVEFVRQVPGPFPMGNRKSTEFIFQFDSAGAKTLFGVTVVDFSEKERLLVLISASAKNFERFHQQAISSMFSWYPVEDKLGE